MSIAIAGKGLRILLGIIFFLSALSAAANVVVREELEPGVFASIRGGATLFLECSPPSGDAAKGFFQKFLADPNEWRIYRNRLAVFIAFNKLNAQTQRRVLLAMFPSDYIDDAGWWHVVRFSGPEGTETLAALCEWLTGNARNAGKVMSLSQNKGIGASLQRGQKVLVPKSLLSPVMRAHKPRPVAATPPPDEINDLCASLQPVSLLNGHDEVLLEYGEDRQGPYAAYALKKGESLYSAVVVRFTDYRDNDAILEACARIAKRSGIRDMHKISAGQRILVPREMLSDRFQPQGSAQRREFEGIREEARRLRETRVRSKDLEGVVIILDPGHGGRDHGASVAHAGLYEDEINYDIVCRIKQALETRTRARVHVTMLDPVQGYTPTNATRFEHDTREMVLTTPRYANQDSRISANLRWYLANDIFARETKNGVDERKIIFASIHCDALFNDSMRGAMVYVPGAKYRREREQPGSNIYRQFAEVRRNPASSTTEAQRRRDEALSTNFAVTLLNTLRAHNPPIKVHDAGDPIRNVIRQSGGKAYLPSVLRNTRAPIKVLVEVANMTNVTDQGHLANPKWRQWFAEAFVEALRQYYNGR